MSAFTYRLGKLLGTAAGLSFTSVPISAVRQHLLKQQLSSGSLMRGAPPGLLVVPNNMFATASMQDPTFFVYGMQVSFQGIVSKHLHQIQQPFLSN